MIKGSHQRQNREEAFHSSPDRGRELMLDVQLNDTRHSAFAYSFLVSIDAELPGLIVLKFTSAEVRIEGGGLKSLYELFLSQRVQLIREWDHSTSENEVNIRRIQVIPLTT